MLNQTIKCPKCGVEIPLTEALTGQIEQNIKLKYETEFAAKDRDYKSKLDVLNQQEKELEAKQQAVEEQIAEKLMAERLKLTEQKRALETQQQKIEEQVAEKLKAERKTIAEAERKKILTEQAEQTKALQEELEEKNKKLSEANKKEFELLRKHRELEEKSEQLELEVERKLSEERKKISQEARKKAAEENMLKMREKDDQLTAMKKQIDELKRKSEIGSQEAQGEALEQQLQEYLESCFPYDKFEEVKKGARGADVLQIVHNPSGKECGKLLWESKNTKDFQKTWTSKLKNDQQDANADIAVIMSVALPSEIKNFGLYDNIWITDYKSVIGLATALRQGLIEATKQKAITLGRDSIKDVVYNYVTSKEFNLHIKAVVNTYKQMQQDLEAEKRSMTRIWSKREKQISTILDNVTGMYGSIEGIVGNQKALPEIETLSLEAITDEDEVMAD